MRSYDDEPAGAVPGVRAGRAAPPPPAMQEILALQRSAGNAAVSPVLDVVGHGGGSPLDPGLRSDMESRLGADFSDVRVHSGGAAAASAASVQAHAYTVGNEIVLGSGRSDLTSPEGQHTLAHELTHVLQQREGPVEGTPVGGGIAVSHPDDPFEREAEATATAACECGPV